MIYLNLDENNYLLSVASIGCGIETNIDLAEYDFTGKRIRAHKWDGETLIFDGDRYAEILVEKEITEEEQPTEVSVYDELAAAYRLGVQEA